MKYKAVLKKEIIKTKDGYDIIKKYYIWYKYWLLVFSFEGYLRDDVDEKIISFDSKVEAETFIAELLKDE